MQTILGAGGAIGKDLARHLKKYTSDIRLVSRNPFKINDTDNLFPADITDPLQVEQALEGTEIAYLTAGFKYDSKVWQEVWPKVMQNVVNACKKHGTRLVFFDNVYMYDRNFLSHMTEETPVMPTSKKGKIRAEIAEYLMNEVQKGNIEALIARSPDFYGPTNSVLIETVYKNLLKGKKADWFVSVDYVHSFINTDDAALGTAILGNTPDAYNQIWHLPTDPTPLKGRNWIEIIAGELGVKPAWREMPKWMLGFAGLFVPILKELNEMVYQYDRDYFFDSSKFTRRFNITPTDPHQGLKTLVRQLKESES